MGIKAFNKRKKEQFSIGTFNVRGLTSQSKQDALSQDVNNYEIDICCLQETKIIDSNDYDTTNGNRLITIPSTSKHYGNGFIIAKRWKEYVHRYWKVSDRICVIQLKTDKSRFKDGNNKTNIDHIITIINVYAPTAERAKKFPHEISQFYTDLTKTTTQLKKLSTSALFIAGDFNSKVGVKRDLETCIGSWSRGYRNENGQRLVDFCENNNKFVCNSVFQHKACHITTWSCKIPDNNTGKMRSIYNQIDYIMMDSDKIQTLIDSRSYGGTMTASDHRIVITRVQTSWSKLYHEQTR